MNHQTMIHQLWKMYSMKISINKMYIIGTIRKFEEKIKNIVSEMVYRKTHDRVTST